MALLAQSRMRIEALAQMARKVRRSKFFDAAVLIASSVI
jgi:hypothetical protein